MRRKRWFRGRVGPKGLKVYGRITHFSTFTTMTRLLLASMLALSTIAFAGSGSSKGKAKAKPHTTQSCSKGQSCLKVQACPKEWMESCVPGCSPRKGC